MQKNNQLTPRIIRTRRKTIALIIEPDGSLVVRAPLRLSKQRIAEIIAEKAEWIRSRQEEFLRKRALFTPHQYVPGEEFWFLGEKHTLKLVQGNNEPLILSTYFLLDQRYQTKGAQVFEAWYRLQARRILSARAEIIAKQLGLRFVRFRLSSARTRWGSCSSLGTISLVWRLVMAPMPVIDYVILHELIHLRVPNHSKEFWSEVEKVMPEWRQRKQWLKLNGNQFIL